MRGAQRPFNSDATVCGGSFLFDGMRLTCPAMMAVSDFSHESLQRCHERMAALRGLTLPITYRTRFVEHHSRNHHPTITMSATNNTATTSGGSPDGWTETFGRSLCILSKSLGMSPQDVALLAAGVMGNISGPAAGLVGASGRRIPPGFNLLFAGTRDCRFRRAAEHLLGPALGMQDFQRENALRGHPLLTDLHKFGPSKIAELAGLGRSFGAYERALEILKAADGDLKLSDAITPNWDKLPDAGGVTFSAERSDKILTDRLPGPRHRPSFIFETSDATRLDEMLAETMDQHLFLIDPTEGFFRGSFLKSMEHGNRAIARLAQHLGGTDVVVPPLHPLQGYGRFQRSRVRFLASLALPRLAEVVGSCEVPHSQVLAQSVLWCPARRVLACHGPAMGAEAWGVYKTALLHVVNARIARRGPVISLLPSDCEQLERAEHELIGEMDQQPASIQPFLGAFSHMIPQLLWAFMLLRQSAEPQWCLKAAVATAHHALKGHVALLHQAIHQVHTQRMARRGERILEVLENKGPCSSRDLQRSLFRGKQSEVTSALEWLLNEKRISFHEQTKQYRLLTAPDPGPRRISGSAAIA